MTFPAPRTFVPAIALAALLVRDVRTPAGARRAPSALRRQPGTRNYVEYGGVGLLVFDIDDGYRFVRRIPTWDAPEGKPPRT